MSELILSLPSGSPLKVRKTFGKHCHGSGVRPIHTGYARARSAARRQTRFSYAEELRHSSRPGSKQRTRVDEAGNYRARLAGHDRGRVVGSKRQWSNEIAHNRTNDT